MTSTTTPPAIRRSAAPALPGQLLKWGMVLVPPILCTGAVLLVWQLLSSGTGSQMPGPIQVIEQTSQWEKLLNPFYDDGSADKGIALQLWISLQRVGIGYLFAAVVGIGVGLLIGTSKFLRQGLDPMIQVLRTVPPLAWLPIALGIFNDNSVAALFVIFITAVWPILINTAVGVQQVPQDYNNVAKVLRLSKREYLTNILLPSTVPYIFTGLRIGIGLAWLAIVAAEMLRSDGGIGFKIWEAYNAGGDSGMSQIIVCVMLVGLVGLVLDRTVGFIGSLVSSDH
jgi:nitrate/nitrite transport system permease protein